MSDKTKNEPVFSRGEVAKILDCTPLTIYNREKSNKYPEPKRDLNNYRIYKLSDVLTLQHITFGNIDTRPLIAVLFDKGFRNPKELGKMIDLAISKRVEGNM